MTHQQHHQPSSPPSSVALPAEVWTIIGSFVDSKTAGHLRRTCKNFFDIFTPFAFRCINLSKQQLNLPLSAVTFPFHYAPYFTHISGSNNQVALLLSSLQDRLHQFKSIHTSVNMRISDVNDYFYDEDGDNEHREQEEEEEEYDDNDVWNWICRCHHLEELHLNRLPDLQYLDAKLINACLKRRKPHWPRLKVLKVSKANGDYFDKKAMQFLLKCAPNLQVLRLFFFDSDLEEHERFDFNLKYPPTLTELYVKHESEPEYIQTSCADLLKIWKNCTNLEKCVISSIHNAKQFKIDFPSLSMKHFEGFISSGDQWFSLDNWRKLLPNLESLKLRGDGTWKMERKKRWTSLKTLSLRGGKGPSLVDVAKFYPNIVSLNLNLAGFFLDDIDEENDEVALLNPPQQGWFSRLESLTLRNTSEVWLNWVIKLIEMRGDGAAKITSLALNGGRRSCSGKTLLKLLQLVGNDLKQINIKKAPADFEPEWLTEFLWPNSKRIKCKIIEFSHSEKLRGKELRARWKQTLKTLRERSGFEEDSFYEEELTDYGF